jgi:hypothetical protein
VIRAFLWWPESFVTGPGTALPMESKVAEALSHSVLVRTVMNTHSNEPSENPDAYYLNAREREGPTLNYENIHSHYGRRIEPDKSWTIYHVFSGVPATIGGRKMTELGEKEATARVLSLNASNAQKRKSAKWRRPLPACPTTARSARL